MVGAFPPCYLDERVTNHPGAWDCLSFSTESPHPGGTPLSGANKGGWSSCQEARVWLLNLVSCLHPLLHSGFIDKVKCYYGHYMLNIVHNLLWASECPVGFREARWLPQALHWWRRGFP